MRVARQHTWEALLILGDGCKKDIKNPCDKFWVEENVAGKKILKL